MTCYCNEITMLSIEMFLPSLRWSFNVLSRRLFSKRSTLPYEVDRFNAARVRLDEWSDDHKLVREQLSSEDVDVGFIHSSMSSII